MHRPARRLARGAATAALVFASIATTLVAVEGLSSVALLAWEMADAPPARPVAERRHTRYDSLLGWVNLPNHYVPDMYGPGVYLRTNAQGFRANSDVPAEVPEGRVRVVCSGDSFTLGYGVDNDHTWCRQLEEADPRLETVNMGQGGYGIDQAFLWYRRDAAAIAHQVHVFALITADFKRMRSAKFLGYPKPTLALENGALTVQHVPVPRQEPDVSRLTRYLPAIRDLRTNLLADKIGEALSLESCSSGHGPDPASWAVVSAVIDELRDLNRARGSVLALTYLPTRRDHHGSCADAWRELIADHCEREGIAFVDLVREFRKLPASEIESMFIERGKLEYRGAAGHYTILGNQWVARTLYESLAAAPDVLPPRPEATAASPKHGTRS